jgi:hypothetical protein
LKSRDSENIALKKERSLESLFLSNRLIFRPKSTIIGRKEKMLDERSSNEII